MKRSLVLTLALMLTLLGSTVTQASPIKYSAFLSGPAEAPPNASPATGFAAVVFDLAAHTMSVDISFDGLLGTTTASHIHAPTALPGVGTAGVATQTPSFVGFPLGVTSGTYSHIFDMTLASSYRAGYLTGFGGSTGAAEAALALAAEEGRAYLNIHTTLFGGGEIRGFLVPAPEPGSSLLLLGIGLAGLRAWKKRIG
jgi:hypothetical protein